MSQELVVRQQMSVDDVSRVAKAYAMSGYWPDASDIAKAFVKVSFGYEVGLPAYIAMSEVHIIQGKPTLGAGALAALVKSHPNYDYHVVEHDLEVCAIEFFDLRLSGESMGVSRFTVEDAKTAGLLSNPTWSKYRRNMLFARSMSNGVAWFCPDVTMGRVYTPEELGGTYTPEELGDEAFDADVVEERPGVASRQEAPEAAGAGSGDAAPAAEPTDAEQVSFADLVPEGARGDA